MLGSEAIKYTPGLCMIGQAVCSQTQTEEESWRPDSAYVEHPVAIQAIHLYMLCPTTLYRANDGDKDLTE